MVDFLTIDDYLEMKATDQANYVRLKTHLMTVPNPNEPAPILKIDQGMIAYKDLLCLGYLASVSKTEVPIQSSGYTNCDPSDIGKQVKVGGDAIPGIVLVHYDNTGVAPYYTKKWWLSGSTSVASGSQMTIDSGGQGAGTSSANSSTYGGGAIKIGHGLTGSTDPPKISLMDSAQGYGTLHIKQADGTTPGNLDLGNLTARGEEPRIYLNCTDHTNWLLWSYPDDMLYWTVAQADGTPDSDKMWLDTSGNLYVDNSIIAGGSGSTNVSLAHDGSHGYVTAHTGDLVLCADSGIVRTGTINPASGANTGKVGNHSGAYWNEIAGYDIWGHTSHLLDAYDDLALVKQWGETNPKLENYDASKIAPPEDDIFSILRLDHEGNVSPNKELLNFGQVANFALGCAKALAKKQDDHDVLLLKLLNEMESLHAEIASLKKTNAGD